MTNPRRMTTRYARLGNVELRLDIDVVVIVDALGGSVGLTLEEARTVQAIGLPAVLPHRQTNPQHPQTCLPDVHPDT